MKYNLYTFQFTPLVNVNELDLFDSPLKRRDELMKKKLLFFRNALLTVKYSYGGKVYNNSIQVDKDNIMVMRLANRKMYVREKAFEKKKEADEPSCGIIIDYRPNHQVIAIEDSIRAFNNTDVVRNIILSALNKELEKKCLKISIKKQLLPSEFWEYAEKYKGKITEVRFLYQYPNLGRTHQAMKEMLENTSKSINSTNTQIIFKGESLEFSQNDDEVKGYVDDSSNSGIPISLRIKGFHKVIKTGKQVKVIDIEEMDYKGNELAFSMLKNQIDSEYE